MLKILKVRLISKIIELQQRRYLKKRRRAQNLFIFLVPGRAFVNGGVRSFHLHAETFESIGEKCMKGGAASILVSFDESETHFKNPFFRSGRRVVSSKVFLKEFADLSSKNVILNIPPIYLIDFKGTALYGSEALGSCGNLIVNILNQNNRNMPPAEDFDYLKTFNLTQTVAFQANCNERQATLCETPVHFLPPIDGREFTPRTFLEKEFKVVVSPDRIEQRGEILDEIHKCGVKIFEIQHMPYEEYLEVLGGSRFCLTLGEGFDYYFVESFFTGGVAFAIYDEYFFPDESYLELLTVFRDVDDLLKNIKTVIEKLSDEDQYQKYNSQVQRILRKQLNHENYCNQVQKYLEANYDIPSTKTECSEIGHVPDFGISSSKVFVIGANKTGTTSLGDFLNRNDYKLGCQKTAEDLFESWKARDWGPIIDYCNQSTAFQDIPFSLDYTYIALDSSFPNSKFILSTRKDSEVWYKSLYSHLQRITKSEIIDASTLYEFTNNHPKGYLLDIFERGFGMERESILDPQRLKKWYDRRNSEVRTYFENRPNDFLEICIDDPNSHQDLYDFLGVNEDIPLNQLNSNPDR
ncbi:MAG: sulfotransferase [Verrucomicrobiales bacterium]